MLPCLIDQTSLSLPFYFFILFYFSVELSISKQTCLIAFSISYLSDLAAVCRPWLKCRFSVLIGVDRSSSLW
ncbi:hypothetical protein LguiB_027025 [Lonicera macranthoides]